MSIIMKDQANKEWLRGSVDLPKSNSEKHIHYGVVILGYFILVVVISLSVISMAIAEQAEELMISSDMKSYMQMNGLISISEWDVE